MYPPPFEYTRADAVDAALGLLADNRGEARLLAGGQSLVPILKMRLTQPRLLVDINGIPGLDEVHVASGELRLGALVREATLVRAPLPHAIQALSDAAKVIADPITRNRGTVGGNLAHGDPANDLPAVMVALDAVGEVRSVDGLTEVPMASFFTGPMETVLGDEGMLVAIRIPVSPGRASAYVKIERQTGDYAVAATAVRLTLERDRIIEARIALTNAGLTPIRCSQAEQALAGRILTDADADEASILAADEASFWPDLRGDVGYKRSAARRATASAIRTAYRRLTGDGS
jgi:carbon-monoxide dehydrogenase medium subunit